MGKKKVITGLDPVISRRLYEMAGSTPAMTVGAI
jgi:hypothetical protein